MAEKTGILQVVNGIGEFNEDGMNGFIKKHGINDVGVGYQIVAITGPQSSGKSTLMNALVRRCIPPGSGKEQCSMASGHVYDCMHWPEFGKDIFTRAERQAYVWAFIFVHAVICSEMWLSLLFPRPPDAQPKRAHALRIAASSHLPRCSSCMR